MYNTDLPTRAELPTAHQLLRSTAIAVAAAATLLVTVVLPAEYAIDPTGVGRMLGLTSMGEIKSQLAQESEANRKENVPPSNSPEKRSGLFERAFSYLSISPAHAQSTGKADEINLTLAPAEGIEVKLGMKAGARANYSWTASGGGLNYDLHGSPASGGAERSYKKGRNEPGDQGVVTAAFDGSHGWFWRNRTSSPVSINLKVNGEYSEIKRMK